MIRKHVIRVLRHVRPWILLAFACVWHCAPSTGFAAAADNPNPPSSPVKLIFIHHSTGGNWLADFNQDSPYGGLGQALMNNNYYVSATNYGWGPDSIGDRTDIVNWPEWFTGPNHAAITSALYSETGQNIEGFGAWSRMAVDPGGLNQIILFKSCFPNSNLYGNPTDEAYAEPNDWEYSVANAKAVYNHLLTYFATRQDKLFVVITAPPLSRKDYPEDKNMSAAARAANARAFNTWLVNNWLTGYAYNNVAVFDYFNVLTSNGGNTDINDIGKTTGNHHRWWNSGIQHVQGLNNDFAAYPTGDSHPSTAGHQKATAEFVSLLNIYYHRWKSDTFAMDVECILNWIVREYSPYFQPSDAQTVWTSDGWAFRYFSVSNAYLGAYSGSEPEYSDKLFYLGPLSADSILDLGSVGMWKLWCNCP